MLLIVKLMEHYVSMISLRNNLNKETKEYKSNITFKRTNKDQECNQIRLIARPVVKELCVNCIDYCFFFQLPFKFKI